MGEFFVYILKSSVCLAVLYLFYRLFLSRETFYNFNRIAILGILILSMLLPFCEVTIQQQTEVQQTVLTLEQLLLMADKITVQDATILPVYEKSVAMWIRVLLWIYIGGILFFVARNIYSFLRLIRLIRTSVRWKLQKGIWIVTHFNTKYSPFSWMKFIVISTKDFEENSREILIHEAAHIRKRHSIDLLITDLCIILQWFNPAAWLFKQELQNIHEYQADEAVLDEGVNAKQYQLLLIKKAAGTRLYSMANSFNHSKLKKRITMMLKRKSNPWARLKYLYVLPVAAIAITAFARPEITKELKEISAVKVNDLTAIVETKEVEKEVLDNKKVDLPVDMHEKRVTLPVSTPSIVQKRDTIVKDEVKIVESGLNVRGMVADTIKNKPLILVNGEEVSNIILDAIDPNKIESLSVLKDQTVTNIYGEKAANGIILINLKRSNKETEFSKYLNDIKLNNKGVGLPKELRGGIRGMALPADIAEFYIDDVKVDRDKFIALSPKDIELVSVNKESEKNTIRIVTKKQQGEEDKIEVKGTVKDVEGNPVVGAAIIEAGSNHGTVTDLDGNFIFRVSPDSEIVISYIGMESVKVKSNKKINVILAKSE